MLAKVLELLLYIEALLISRQINSQYFISCHSTVIRVSSFAGVLNLALHKGKFTSCIVVHVLPCSCELYSNKAGFPLGEFVRANRERSNLIGW